MSDMICRKNMMRCQTPSMCAPFGGCRDESMPSVAAICAERDALAQRCRELEEDVSEQAALLEEACGQRDFLDKLQSDEGFRREKAEAERDTLRAEVERLREIREIASQCAANGGYLSSQDLIELRYLLRSTK